MLCFYGQFKYVYSYSTGIDIRRNIHRRQNLSYEVDSRAVGVQVGLTNSASSTFKTHHYIIFFIRPQHSKPGIESYCSSSTEQLS